MTNRPTSPTHVTPARRAAAPSLPPWHLSRPRLLEALDGAVHSRVLVVRGPRGSGKTALLREWVDSRGLRANTLWVPLDDTIASRTDFWDRIRAALASSDATARIAERLNTTRDSPALLAALIDELDDELHVVLDDFHHIDAHLVEELTTMLEHTEMLRVTVATRRIRPFDLPEAALRLAPTVLSSRDLALSPVETAALIAATTRLDAPTAEIIHEETRGHVLAVRLASAALAHDAPVDPPLIAARIRAAVAPHVIPELEASRLDAAVRLAIAPHVGVALGHALTGRDDIAQLLAEFERDGLGTATGEGELLRFRFQPLVATALRHLVDRIDDAELNGLRLAAAIALEDEDEPLDSLALLIAARRHDLVWRHFLRNSASLAGRLASEAEPVLLQVPQAALRTHGEIGIALAIARTGRREATNGRSLTLIERSLESLAARADSESSVTRILTLSAILAGCCASRRATEAVRTADEILSAVDALGPATPPDAHDTIDAVLAQVASTYLAHGRMGDASTVAHRIGLSTQPSRALHVASVRAVADAVRGDMTGAGTTLAQLPHAPHRARAPEDGIAFDLALAGSLRDIEAGDARSALRTIDSLGGGRAARDTWAYAVWARGLARLHLCDSLVGADEVVARLHGLRYRSTGRHARDLLTAITADLLLAAGERERARRTLSGTRPDSAPLLLAASRLEFADARFGEAHELVAPVAWGDIGDPRQHAEAHLIRAVCSVRLGLIGEANLGVRRALSLLRAHGLRSPLAMVPRADLLLALRHADEEADGDDVLARRPSLDGIGDPFGAALSHHSLTTRELEVLAALASAPNLDAVASRLYVSVNTIKTQVRSVYRKLGVSSRDEAVRSARQRGVLPG